VSNDVYRDLLYDLIMEINALAMREDNWGDTSFDRGYIAGMFVIMKAVQEEIAAFKLPKTKYSKRLIDVDEWFRLGKDYKFDLPG